jgi:hypothetical protein
VTEGAEEIWALGQEMAKLELGMTFRGYMTFFKWWQQFARRS